MHSLLARQLKRCFGESWRIPDQWRDFIRAVNDAYEEFDADRRLLERSLDLSSQELLQANSEMGAIFQAIPDLLLRVEADGTILDYKAGSLEGFSLLPDELVGKRLEELPSIGDPESLRDVMARVQEHKAMSVIEYAIMTNGQERFCEARFMPLPGDQVIVIIRDITDKRMAQDELKRSGELYRTIFENTGTASILIAKDTTILLANSNFEKLTGYSKQEMEGRMSWTVFIVEEDLQMMKKFHELRRKDPALAPTSYEFRLKNRFGGVRDIFLTVDMIPGTSESIASCMDITERKRAEAELRRSEERYRNILDNMEEAYYEVDLKGNILFVNPATCRMIGYPEDEILAKSFRDFMDKENIKAVYDTFNRLFRTGESATLFDWEFIRKNGEKLVVESSVYLIRDAGGTPTGFMGIGRDITERKKAEEEKKRLETQLAQAQKMESIGTLAGGIAHDFNNILSAIIGYTELAMNDIADPVRAGAELGEVLKAGERAKDLVSQILTFSRQTETRHSPLAIKTVVKESLKMIRSVTPSNIEIRSDLADSGVILSDPTQINQVMLNLCTNAVHAMGKTGGILEVGLRRVHAEGGSELRDLDLVPGTYMRLEVRDTGHGMSPEVMSRIFDPYFTTKEVGRGTGLGLAVVHGIVKSHGGAITCESVPGEGTTFRVYFPEIESMEQASAPLSKGDLPTGTERILFVDDEQVLVNLARRMMESLGYTVFTRTSSIEALEFFRANPDKFDLVITDMTMPGMTGDMLTKKILKIRKDIPVILCSGYSEHMSEERSKLIGIREFIMKPIVMKDLAKTIRKVLDSRA
ncbi:MAG TPA: PAS domain S-box protein [Deltaproteobacteria bacterium]|nr:PAS domain S-box protein [Deltaproteobacteria bacterium]